MFNKMKIYQRVILLVWLGVSAGFAHAATDCNQVTEIPVSECQSLLELYNSTDGANWTNKTGWNQTNTPCSWFGVNCHIISDVTSIQLSNNNLVGTLPNLNLPYLQDLSLGSNQLSGTIPNFSNLPNLQWLYLRSNQLSGTIPNFTAFNLANLFSAYFHSNCGLTAYDAAQENILNQKDLNWNIRNPNCPASTFSVTLNKTGTGSGTVSGDGNFAAGTIVSLTATPDANSTFTGWSGDCSGTVSPISIVVDKAKSCIANFNVELTIVVNPGSPGTPGAGVTYIPLTVTKPTNGEILETDVSCNTINCKPFETKLNCGTDCIISYAPSAAVTLTAKPAQGFMVDSWTGCGSISTDTLNCQVIMDAAKSVNVLFKEIPPSSFDLTIKTTGYGTVNSNPTGIDCNSTCIKTYAKNTSIALIANPAQGFMVDNWQGCDSVSTDKLNCQLAMNATKAVNITFKEIPPPSFELKVQSMGSGSVISNPTGINCNPDCVENYIQNTTITLTAKPVQGFTIDKWEGCNVDKLSCQISADSWQSCENIDKLTCQVTMDKAKQVKATFISQAVCNKPKPAAPQMTLSTKNDFVVLASNEIVNADEYILYYAPYSNPPSEVTTNNIGSFSLSSNRSISATLPANTNLYVAVTAKNCAGESGYSNIGTILIPSKLADAPEGYNTAVIPQGYEKISKEQAWIQEKARAAVFSVDLPPQERTTALKSIAGITNAICDTASCSITMANGETMSFVKTESLVPKNMDLTALTTNISSSSATRRANPRRASISGANCPGTRKALILGAANQTFATAISNPASDVLAFDIFGFKRFYSKEMEVYLQEMNSGIKRLLEYNGYIVDMYEADKADLSAFELINKNDYSVIVISGHGSPNGTIQTGERLCTLCSLPHGTERLYESIKVGTKDYYIGIKANWWNGSSLNGKYIHFESCSLFNADSLLPDVLRKNKIGVATGYTDGAVVSTYTPYLLFTGLLQEEMPISKVTNEIKTGAFYFNNWKADPYDLFNTRLLTFISSSPEYAANYYIDGDVCHVNKYAIQIKGSDGKEIENVVVKIYDSNNQELVKSVQGSTLSKAIFDLSLDPTQIYRMTLSKDGYVTKTIVLDKPAFDALTTQTTYTLEKVAPPILTATAGVETVGLSWNAISGSQFYNLYRKADGDTAFSLLKSNVNAIKYDDANVAAKKYCYKVNTNDNLKNIEGLPSNEVCVTPTAKTSTDYTGVDRYVAYDDGTAYDKVTGLTWMRCSVGQIWNATTKQCDGQVMTFTFTEALKQTNNFADYSNWTLPDSYELSSLVFCSNGKPMYFAQTSKSGIGCQGGQYSFTAPVIVKEIFPNTPKLDYGGIFWTSSGGGHSSYYLGVAFGLNGNITSTMYKNTKYPIRLVLRNKTSLGGTAGTETISLGWSNAVAVKGNKTYNLYRKIDGEANFTLLKPNLTEITYTDTNLAIKRHCYKVDVSGVASTTSNEFCITPAAKPRTCTGWYLNCI